MANAVTFTQADLQLLGRIVRIVANDPAADGALLSEIGRLAERIAALLPPEP